MYWISSNFCSKLLAFASVFAWKHKWKRSKTLPCAPSLWSRVWPRPPNLIKIYRDRVFVSETWNDNPNFRWRRRWKTRGVCTVLKLRSSHWKVREYMQRYTTIYFHIWTFIYKTTFICEFSEDDSVIEEWFQEIFWEIKWDKIRCQSLLTRQPNGRLAL